VRTDGLKPAPNSVCAKRPSVFSWLNTDGTLCPGSFGVYTATAASKQTKSHQSTSSYDNINNNNRINSDNGNNDNKNSNNATATTGWIYFNKKSRRQRPQGRTKAMAPIDNNQRYNIVAPFKDIADSDPDDARRILSRPAIHNFPEPCFVHRFS
jgi:hypothetical protein